MGILFCLSLSAEPCFHIFLVLLLCANKHEQSDTYEGIHTYLERIILQFADVRRRFVQVEALRDGEIAHVLLIEID